MKKISNIGVLVFGVCFFMFSTAFSYELPSVNLGFTSFLDGGPPAGAGWYYTQYLQYFAADRFTDADGDDGVLFPDGDPDLNIWVALCQLIYQSDQIAILGARWGMDMILPVVDLNVDFNGTGYISDNGSGLGDLLVGPYLQWDPIIGENGPVFIHRVELQFILIFRRPTKLFRTCSGSVSAGITSNRSPTPGLMETISPTPGRKFLPSVPVPYAISGSMIIYS